MADQDPLDPDVFPERERPDDWRAEIGGWQDHAGALHDGSPGNFDDVNVLRVVGPDPESGEDRWFSIVGPFPDFASEDDWLDWIYEWWDANYGELA